MVSQKFGMNLLVYGVCITRTKQFQAVVGLSAVASSIVVVSVLTRRALLHIVTCDMKAAHK